MKNAFLRAMSRFAVGLLVLLSSIAIHAQPQYNVTELGPPPVGDWFHAVAINNDQQIIGCGYPNTYDPTTPGLPILFWSPATGFVDTSLRTYNSTCSSLVDINNRGQVLLKAANGRTYLWHPTEPSIDIGLPDIACAPGDMMCVPTDDCRYNNCATALNNHGHIVGFYHSDQPPFNRAFRWTPGTGLVDLSILPNAYFSNWFHFQGLTDNGDIVGLGENTLSPSTGQAFIWNPTSGLYPILGASESGESSPYAISANGLVVGMSAHIGPFMWSPAHGTTPLPPDFGLAGWGPVWDVNVQGQVVNGSTLWSAIEGRTDLNLLIPHTAQTVPAARGKLNDYGDLVVNDTFRMRTFLLTRQRLELTVDLIDPYPDFIRGGVVKDTGGLATKGTIVRGVAADGVATIVLRLKTANPGESVTLTVPGSMEENGFLSVLGSTPNAQSVTVTSNAQALAFALYRAPLDFAWRADQHSLATRNVDLTVSYGGAQQALTIDVVRPPIMLVHGLWSNHRTWDSFVPLSDGSDLRFQTYRANYAPSEALGITKVSSVYLEQLWRALDAFRRNHSVASAQVDLVAHSMGGLVARAATLYQDYDVAYGIGRGPVHKMITLDTPHLGSGFASQLLAEGPDCRQKFEDEGKPVRQNVTDLADGSPLVMKLAAASGKFSIPTHAVVGMTIPEDQAATEQNWNAPRTTIASWLRSLYCPTLLPPGGFNAVLGPDSDLIVSNKSQRAFQLGRTEVIPWSGLPFVNHAVDNIIFKFGGDVLGRTVIDGNVVDNPDDRDVVVNQVIVLLNQPVTSPWYKLIRP